MDEYTVAPVPKVPPHELLGRTLSRQIQDAGRCALALSGGLDSALILGVLKELDCDQVSVFTLTTDMPGYCEKELTRQTAAYYGVELHEVSATERDFVKLLPTAIAAAEVPLYNLHPVSKLLLGIRIKELGFDSIITGDAADQAFAGVPSANYLPIVGAMMRSIELNYLSPFFDEHVVTYGRSVGDPEKQALRKLAERLVPPFVFDAPKCPRYAPTMDITQHWKPSHVERIVEQTGLLCNPQTDHDRTLWTSLGLLAEALWRDN